MLCCLKNILLNLIFLFKLLSCTNAKAALISEGSSWYPISSKTNLRSQNKYNHNQKQFTITKQIQKHQLLNYDQSYKYNLLLILLYENLKKLEEYKLLKFLNNKQRFNI